MKALIGSDNAALIFRVVRTVTRSVQRAARVLLQTPTRSGDSIARLRKCPSCRQVTFALVNIDEVRGGCAASGIYWTEDWKCRRCGHREERLGVPGL